MSGPTQSSGSYTSLHPLPSRQNEPLEAQDLQETSRSRRGRLPRLSNPSSRTKVQASRSQRGRSVWVTPVTGVRYASRSMQWKGATTRNANEP
eukprot:3090994-Amphidinium_carterae.1